MNYNFIKAFPEEEFCRHLLSALNLNVNIKQKIREQKKLSKDVLLEKIISESASEISCPMCHYFKVYRLKSDTHTFKCSGCNNKFNERHGTILQGGKLNLSQYFVAIFLNNTYKSLTYESLAKVIGTTKESAGKILKKIRLVKETTKNNKDNGKCKIENLEHNKYRVATLDDYLQSHPNLSEIKKIFHTEGLSFISYPSSKRSLIDKIVKRLPVKINNYWEPFLGGGTVFFVIHALKQVRIIDAGKMHIADYNKGLIEVYKALKESKPEDIFAILDKYAVEYNSLLTIEERKKFFKVLDVFIITVKAVFISSLH